MVKISIVFLIGSILIAIFIFLIIAGFFEEPILGGDEPGLDSQTKLSEEEIKKWEDSHRKAKEKMRKPFKDSP